MLSSWPNPTPTSSPPARRRFMVTLQVLPCGDGPPDVPRLLLGLTGERFHGYPLAEVRDAYRELEQRHTRGKIVLAHLLFERPNIVSLDEPVAAFSSGFSAATSAAMAAPAAMATESAVPAEAAMLSEAAMGKAVTPVAMTPVAVIPVAMVPAMVPAAPAAIVKTDRAIGRIADVSVVSGTRATAEEETDADHERYSPRQ